MNDRFITLFFIKNISLFISLEKRSKLTVRVRKTDGGKGGLRGLRHRYIYPYLLLNLAVPYSFLGSYCLFFFDETFLISLSQGTLVPCDHSDTTTMKTADSQLTTEDSLKTAVGCRPICWAAPSGRSQ